MVDKIKFRIKIRIGNRGTGWISVPFLFKMEEMMKKIIDCLKENDNQIYNKKPAFYSNLTVLAGRIREMI